MQSSKLISILAAAVVVFSFAMVPTPVHAAEGSAPGSFVVGNVAPSVTSVDLCTAGGSSTNDINPQQEFNVKVDVTDGNTINDLSSVTVRIFYDADGGYSAGEESGAVDNQTKAIITWSKAGGFSIAPSGGGTTWSLESSVAPSPMTSSEGIFEFHFKPGKVATETKSGAKWQIYAQAYDGTATASANQTGKNMNWFGEVTVNTASVDWGSVTPGTTWGDSTKQTGISVKYISNGAYDEQVAASAQWAGTSDNATLDAAGNCTNTNEFSLKADDTATLPGDGLVPATPSYLTIDNTGAQTSELGDTVATNTLWLKLSPVFLSKTTYNGTIYYQVVNHT